MSLTIQGIGTAVPDTILLQHEAMELARGLCCRTPEQQTWLPMMYSHTGIEKRHLVLPRAVVRDVLEGTRKSGSIFLPTGEPDDSGPTTAERMRIYAQEVGPLALRAASRALATSHSAPRAITDLVLVTCTGFVSPGMDRALIEGLGFSPKVRRSHIGFMGCHGAINGLRVAQAIAESDAKAKIMLCAVELCSLHYHYGWNPQKIIANALFADGAAALIGERGGSDLSDWKVRSTASCVIPDSHQAMTWTVGDHGFEMSLSKKVPELIARHVRPWLETWLREEGFSLSEIRSWAIHPGGPRILEAVEEALHLPRGATSASREVLAEHGNMSSPTILFILERLRQAKSERPCVMLAFGPGLVAEAALVR